MITGYCINTFRLTPEYLCHSGTLHNRSLGKKQGINTESFLPVFKSLDTKQSQRPIAARVLWGGFCHYGSQFLRRGNLSKANWREGRIRKLNLFQQCPSGLSWSYLPQGAEQLHPGFSANLIMSELVYNSQIGKPLRGNRGRGQN